MKLSEKEETDVFYCCFYTICFLFAGLSLVIISHNNRSIERPNIYVNSASVNPFAISITTSPLTPKWKIIFMTAVWNFSFAVQNPNKKFAMSFMGFGFNVSYRKDVLLSGSMEPFELKKKELNLVNMTMNTLPATLSEQVAKGMEDELQTSKVVNFHITIKGLMNGDALLSPRCITTHCENLKMVFSSDRNQSAFSGKMPGPSKCQVLWRTCHAFEW